MEKSGAQAPKPNEMILYSWEDYALTKIETSQAVEFLMTKLEPVHIEDDNFGTHVCVICQQKFSDSEDLKHTPVKMPCGHIFGKSRIIRWLDPLWGWGSKEDGFDALSRPYTYGRTDCPICRKVCFSEPMREPMEGLAQRLSFWDMAYAAAGVARSAREERSRKFLWEFVEYCRSMNDHESPNPKALSHAQALLWRWSHNLKYEDLTPLQASLRVKLERIGRKDLTKCAFTNGSYVFDLDRKDDEIRMPRLGFF